MLKDKIPNGTKTTGNQGVFLMAKIHRKMTFFQLDGFS